MTCCSSWRVVSTSSRSAPGAIQDHHDVVLGVGLAEGNQLVLDRLALIRERRIHLLRVLYSTIAICFVTSTP